MTTATAQSSNVLEVLQESHVYGVLGYRGEGKSLITTKLAYEVYLAGGRVLHEGQLRFGETFNATDLANQDTESLGGCLLVMDEVSALMPSSRSHSTFQLLIKNNLIQSRHQGLSVIYNTQFAADVPRALVNQTDWVFKPWRNWKHDWVDTNKCEGFKSHRCTEKKKCMNEYYHHHNPDPPLSKCIDSKKRHTIKYKAVPQLGNPYHGRPPLEYTLHCAQRLYSLYDTNYKIDGTNTMLETTDSLRAKNLSGLQSEVVNLVADLASDGVQEITALIFKQEVLDHLGQDIELRSLERMLGAIGVEKTLENGVNKFQFGDWANEYLES